MARSLVRYQVYTELGLKAFDSATSDRFAILRSGTAYIFRANVGDGWASKSLITPSGNLFNDTDCSILRDRRAVLELSPGRYTEDATGEGCRGFQDLETDVRTPLQKLLRRTDLPKVRLVGFPSTWPGEFVEWSDQPDVQLGNSRGVEWVQKDGTVVPFMPDDNPETSEVSVKPIFFLSRTHLFLLTEILTDTSPSDARGPYPAQHRPAQPPFRHSERRGPRRLCLSHGRGPCESQPVRIFEHDGPLTAPQYALPLQYTLAGPLCYPTKR